MIQKCSLWSVFKVFLDSPLKRWHIREISRTIKLAPTSVKLHMGELIKQELVFEKKEVFKYYTANFDSEEFRFYKRINCLLNIKQSGLIKFIEASCSPDSIFLFGSCAKGEDTSESDLDLYVQCKEKKIDVGKYEKLLKRRIQLFFSEDFNKLPKELRNNILNGIKLSGYLKVF